MFRGPLKKQHHDITVLTVMYQTGMFFALIEDRVDSQRRQQIQSNRYYLKTLAEIRTVALW